MVTRQRNHNPQESNRPQSLEEEELEDHIHHCCHPAPSTKLHFLTIGKGRQSQLEPVWCVLATQLLWPLLSLLTYQIKSHDQADYDDRHCTTFHARSSFSSIHNPVTICNKPFDTFAMLPFAPHISRRFLLVCVFCALVRALDQDGFGFSLRMHGFRLYTVMLPSPRKQPCDSLWYLRGFRDAKDTK